MHIRGITKRWLINSLGLIVIILVILILSFAFVVRNYYYNGIQSTIQGHVSGISSYRLAALNDRQILTAQKIRCNRNTDGTLIVDGHDRCGNIRPAPARPEAIPTISAPPTPI